MPVNRMRPREICKIEVKRESGRLVFAARRPIFFAGSKLSIQICSSSALGFSEPSPS